jgi:hypothetical protein
MTGDLLEKCRLAMIFIDKDRDNILDQNEFGQLADRLRTEIDGGVSYKKAKDVYDAHYEVVAEAHGGSPSLKGSKPNHIASDEEGATLKELCQATFDAMKEAMGGDSNDNADVLVKNTVVGDDADGGKEMDLDPQVMSECKRSIYVSDRDRNDGLDVDEFVFLVNRLQEDEKDTEPYEGFGDLHDAFHVLYRDLSTYNEYVNAFLVSTAGSKPGLRPTGDETEHLESVCKAVYFALEELLID